MDISRREAIAGTAALLVGFAMGKPTRGAVGAASASRTSAAGWVNPYVTDSLIAMWDGEWNVAGGVHDATATSWKDLVGTRDATLSGTYSWGAKSWVRDAFSSTKCLLPNIPLGQNFTIEYCCALHNAGDANLRDIAIPSGTRFEIVQNTNNSTTLYYKNSKGAMVSRAALDVGTLKTGRTTTWGFDTQGGIYSLNGGSPYYDRTENTVIDNAYGNVTFSIGQFSTLSEDADYYNIRLYSRALTAAEIEANYEIDKKRFNLP